MIAIKRDIPLHDKTTFKIGGSARWYCSPANPEDVAEAIAWAERESLPVLVLGKGSNILVSDRGWPGLVVHCSTSFSRIEWTATSVTAQAGAPLDGVVKESVHRGFTGMEELSGIPGTIGGAVVMNAGAFSSCIANTLQEATCYSLDNHRIVAAKAAELDLGYRTSALQRFSALVLSARFELRRGYVGDLMAIRCAILEKRRTKQPLDLPNCGSVFKRPPGRFAGALIEEAGLKGYRYGNVAISPKHANFIVNLGGGTAAEVRRLVVTAQRAVYERFGILLEPEVIFNGEFEEPLFRPPEPAA